MTNIIKFPVKKRPTPIDLDTSYDLYGITTEEEALERLTHEKIRQERLARIRKSLEQINSLMESMNKRRGIDYDFFED